MPASAVNTGILGPDYYVGETITLSSPAVICAYAGVSPPYAGYENAVTPFRVGISGYPDNWYFNQSATINPYTLGYTVPSTAYSYIVETAACAGGGQYAYRFFPIKSGNRTVIPNLNFTASPTYGFVPLQVNFSASSNQTNTIWSWNFGDGQSSNGSVSNPLHTYTLPGVYTVRLDAYSSSFGWMNLTQINYITATNSSGIVVNLDVKDATTGGLLAGSTVGIYNTSSKQWRNSTSPTGLVYFDTTDPGFLYPLSTGQTIGESASMPGYQSANITFVIPYSNYCSYIYLVPSSVVNSTGTGTAVVNVVGNSNGVPISGVSLAVDTGQIGITNTAGSVTFYNVTSGSRLITASDSGYQTVTQTYNQTAGSTSMVIIQLILNGQTPSPTFAPYVTTTVNPYVTDANGSIITDANGNTIQRSDSASGGLNEEATTGLMGMMEFMFQLWPLAILLIILKAFKAI